MLWFESSSQDIHKIIKGSNVSFEASDDKDHNLSRRFIDFGKQHERKDGDKMRMETWAPLRWSAGFSKRR